MATRACWRTDAAVVGRVVLTLDGKTVADVTEPKPVKSVATGLVV